MTAGKYAVSGKFRLGEFDYSKLTYNTSPAYNVTANNNTAILTLKAGESSAAGDIEITNDWTDCSFVIDVADGTPLNDIVMAFRGRISPIT